jgi:hypothetical protein
MYVPAISASSAAFLATEPLLFVLRVLVNVCKRFTSSILNTTAPVRLALSSTTDIFNQELDVVKYFR